MTLRNKIAIAAAALMLAAGPVLAQGAAEKAAVDAAKAAGTVGEQGDGYLGIVSAAPPAVAAAVTAINAGRAQVYADTAAKSGVSREAAGQATGEQLIARTPAGQFVKPLGGGWTKK
jgi:uncharacterized protein YdbL (DUF1318 family)